jgi:hypothetical protein
MPARRPAMFCAIALAAALAAAPAAAAPVTMTFDALAIGAFLGPYTEAGFVATLSGGDLANAANAGSGNLQNNPFGSAAVAFAALIIEAADGSPFTFLAADIANFNGNFTSPLIDGVQTSAIFVQGFDGLTPVFGSTMTANSQAYATQGSPAPGTPITRLVFGLGTGAFPSAIESIDNLRLDNLAATPEPASLSLLATAGAALLLRRRQRRSA